MKARITVLLAVVVVALSVVAGASADAFKPGTVKGWDYYNGAGSVKPWTIRGWQIKQWGSSWSSLHHPDPSVIRFGIKSW